MKPMPKIFILIIFHLKMEFSIDFVYFYFLRYILYIFDLCMFDASHFLNMELTEEINRIHLSNIVTACYYYIIFRNSYINQMAY